MPAPWRLRCSLYWQHVSNHPLTRVDAPCDTMTVIAGNDDRVAVRVEARHDSDMSVAATAIEHRDCTHAGRGARKLQEAFGQIRSGTAIARAREGPIHETPAPQRCATVDGSVPKLRLCEHDEGISGSGAGLGHRRVDASAFVAKQDSRRLPRPHVQD